MKVSIIIAAWNEQRLLNNTIDCIKKQTFPADEVIVVDDRSMEPLRVPSWCKLIRLDDKDSSARSSGTARNAGISASSGDMIFIIDHDQVFTSDALEVMLGQYDRIRAVNDLAIITAPVVWLGNHHPYSATADELLLIMTGEVGTDDGVPYLKDRNFSEGYVETEQCLAAIPRVVFDRVGLYDDTSFSRWGWINQDMCIRVLDAGGIISSWLRRANGDRLYTFDCGQDIRRKMPFKRDNSVWDEFAKKYEDRFRIDRLGERTVRIVPK